MMRVTGMLAGAETLRMQRPQAAVGQDRERRAQGAALR